MRLSPREEDHLMLHAAGALAQKRLARGLRLNYTEAVALLATQVLEFIRDGKTVAELMTLGAQMLGRLATALCNGRTTTQQRLNPLACSFDITGAR